MWEPIGQKLGDYEILFELGRGAMGVVYKARQYSLDRLVALKILAPELARDPEYIERFKREAIIAATVTHPNIVTVYEADTYLDLGSSERFHYFAMEYVEGETVQQRLAREGRIPADEVAAIGVRIAEGLETAWKKARIIHRDIKPSNIFLSHHGEAKIGDLGLARVAGDAQSSLTATGVIIGTAYYMSPEQARGKSDVDFRSDIYSLGCVLYRMLCGRHVYEGAFATILVKHLTEPPPSLRMIVPDCPVAIVNVINKMLTKNPNDRQQSYAELIEDLRRAHERIMAGDAQEPANIQPPAPAPRKPMVWALGLAATAAVAGILCWSPWKTEREVASLERRAPGVAPVSALAAPVPPTTPNPSAKPESSPTPPAVPEPPAKPVESPSVAKAACAPKPPAIATNPSTANGTLPLTAKPAVESVIAEAFLKEVAALPPEQQVTRVLAKLKELNPAFDGKETHVIENGAVTTLGLSTVGVTNIVPLQALSSLQRLSIAPFSTNQQGALTDLSALKGLSLKGLACRNNPIRDLTPLRGMPLTALGASATQVSDLSPLAGMKLTNLSINDTLVSDLSPIAGMPLTVLGCHNTKVTNLSPLAGMPLQQVRCDYVAARDAAVLRDLRSLKMVNNVEPALLGLRTGPIPAGATSTFRNAAGPALMTSIGMELVLIPAGECMIGSTPEERFQAANPETHGPHDTQEQFEGNQPRKVVFRQPFRLGRTEVTVGQWKQFVKATGYVTDGEKKGRSFSRVGNGGWSEYAKGASWKKPGFDREPLDDHPVCCISWNDAMAFCAWLDKQEQSRTRLGTGWKIRLPTEAEWEYACRAGQPTKYWWGDSMDDNEDRLRLKWKSTAHRDSPDGPDPVDHHGDRGRNGFGLADMLGNVWEWCLDSFDPNGAHAEPWMGNGSQHVTKGGAFTCMHMGPPRCASRQSLGASYSSALCGFRVACGVEVTAKTGSHP